MPHLSMLGQRVNRHTGGLENCVSCGSLTSCVNRHTGGLEILDCWCRSIRIVNRHTGGLEMNISGGVFL